MKRTFLTFFIPIGLVLGACSSGGDGGTVPPGGAAATGGNSPVGGAPFGGGTGGATEPTTGGLGAGGLATGGFGTGGIATGGAATGGGPSGGAPVGGSGGMGGVATGGVATGGVATGGVATGGAEPTGGAQPTGGVSETGGAGEMGGTVPIGGQETGGASTGGEAGSAATGGATGGSGGAGTGGATATWPTCAISDSDLQSAFTAWEGAYVVDCGANGKRVRGCGADTCSEAMGYGMLIAVNMDAQPLFQSFVTFVESLLPIDSAGGNFAGRYLLPWSIGGCSGASDYNNAPDGDLDIALALLQAEVRWPGNGYRELALHVVRDILTYNTAVYSGRLVLLAGDSTLQPPTNGNYPSYFAPGYYRAFAAALESSAEPDGADLAAQYLELATATYELFDGYQAAMDNKLWPEFANLDGTLRNGDQGYWWNACRTPWRIATDWAWYRDANAERQLRTAAAANPDPYAAATEKNSAFVGALTFLHMPAGQEAFQAACTTWLNSSMADNVYFQDSLRLLYLLLAAGRFPPPA